MKEVQAFILNISFPKTMDEFIFFLKDNFHFNVDDILKENIVEWTAPKWCKINDIVLFMHSKTAISTITKLRTEYYNNQKLYTKEQCDLIEKGITHAIDNYKKYGGKIYAIGRVKKPPIYDNFYREESKVHWGSRFYAFISDIIVLKKPVDISEFNDFILVSRQSSITGVFGKEYMKIKELILSKNRTKKYFVESVSAVLPIRDINKTNWLNISNEFRREFFLESQFRSYYVDYLLENLTDSRVYKECPCKTDDKPDCFVDNVIMVNSRPLLVEIKLNVNSEKDILKQMNKYCNCEKIVLNNKIYLTENCYNSKAIIIDTENIYLYDNKMQRISSIIELDKIKNQKMINNVKEMIIKKLETD